MNGFDTCYGHCPDLAEERRSAASKGGRSGGRGRPGRGEVREIKGQIKALIGGVLSGKVDRAVGATAFQGFNILLRAVEAERKVAEMDELLARIEALERPTDLGAGKTDGRHRASSAQTRALTPG